MAAPAAPLALICSHKRTLANGHARETSAACVDGDFAVTSSWDGELRVWREHSDAVASAFGEGNYLRQSVHADGAYAAAKAFVDAAAADPNAKILFHCSGGVNRTSMGMAMWLGAKHGLSPGAAEDAIKAAAAAHGTTRKPSAAKLETFMTAGKLPLKTKKPRGPLTVCQPEATGTCKNNQGKGKVIKGVAVAVAAAALGVVLLPFQ